ncbi:hypothetical protein PVK06_048971 [Gossypium arboreum]|uniref:Uncharacterized protein n=1 Tax=Gossypium arboreum TaxID=29729 RepID=A0ABR0MHC7_GOSAR|nr:hypothetical protein PVK06_048971 [Gossypium arboreum]
MCGEIPQNFYAFNMEEIKELEDQAMCWPRLAEEIARFVHGGHSFSEAILATEALGPKSETKMDWKTIEGIAKDVPS